MGSGKEYAQVIIIHAETKCMTSVEYCPGARLSYAAFFIRVIVVKLKSIRLIGTYTSFLFSFFLFTVRKKTIYTRDKYQYDVLLANR